MGGDSNFFGWGGTALDGGGLPLDGGGSPPIPPLIGTPCVRDRVNVFVEYGSILWILSDLPTRISNLLIIQDAKFIH